MRSLPAMLPLVLASCFIITEQDILEHDRKLGKDEADADADSDTDTDADTDTDTDADTDTNNPDAPWVEALTARVDIDYIEFTFELADATGDLEGGQVQLLEDGADLGFYQLGGLGWNGTSATLGRAEAFPCTGFDRSYTLVPIDAAGNTGLPYAVQVTLAGVALDEANDPWDAGTVTFPMLVCGRHDEPTATGYPYYYYYSDYGDTLRFETPSEGIYRISLLHDNVNDRDAALYDYNYNELGFTDDMLYPESFSYLFFADTYHLQIWQDSDYPGNYRLFVTE